MDWNPSLGLGGELASLGKTMLRGKRLNKNLRMRGLGCTLPAPHYQP